MSNQTDTDPSLHDLLALGQLEVALAPEKRPSIDHDDHPERQTDEIRRLPLLLRMLSASQPLSSIPSLKTDQPQHTVTSEDGEDAVDPLVDQVVARLERVAASHAVAERVDASTSYHAPVTCRKISSLLPLKRDANKLEWNTRDLASVAASPLGPPLKKKRRERLAKMPADGEAMDEDNGDEDDVMSVDETMDAPLDQGIQTNEDPAASSDSQEAMTTKSLMEIAKLVVASLEPTTTHENKDEEDGKSSLLLPVTTDSLLSEAASDLDGGCAGAVGGFDFRASVAALMHHAPVLRHEHVAVRQKCVSWTNVMVLHLYSHQLFPLDLHRMLCAVLPLRNLPFSLRHWEQTVHLPYHVCYADASLLMQLLIQVKIQRQPLSIRPSKVS